MINLISNQVLVGSWRDANSKKILSLHNPKTIVNLCLKKDEKILPIRYKHIPLCDGGRNSDKKLKSVVRYIQRRIKQGKGPVLVHCYAGKSRSIAITVLCRYLKYRTCGFEWHYQNVKSLRRSALINPKLLISIERVAKQMAEEDEKYLDYLKSVKSKKVSA